MNPVRSVDSGSSDPPKFLAQLESQALERFGTGLLAVDVSPIQKTVVTIWTCQGYFSPGWANGSFCKLLGSLLKRMLSRSFIAFSVKRAAPSLAVCAKRADAPVETRPHTNVKSNPSFLIKKNRSLEAAATCVNDRSCPKSCKRLPVNVKNRSYMTLSNRKMSRFRSKTTIPLNPEIMKSRIKNARRSAIAQRWCKHSHRGHKGRRRFLKISRNGMDGNRSVRAN